MLLLKKNDIFANHKSEYNHYVLKGDLEKKKNILIKIAASLEPKKSGIKGINNQLCNDYFYLVNNMDIRHNNCDSSDKSNYNAYFDKLTIREKEEWYDEIYQMGLLIFLLLENKGRSTRIYKVVLRNRSFSFEYYGETH